MLTKLYFYQQMLTVFISYCCKLKRTRAQTFSLNIAPSSKIILFTGLFYFILLAIIGLSTVTTSMFVFLERDVRVKHQIPWYLRWLSFDIANNKITRCVYYQNRLRKKRNIQLKSHQPGLIPRGILVKPLGSLLHLQSLHLPR